MVFCVSCGHKLAGRYCGQCGGDSQSTADAQAEVPVLTVPAGGAKNLLTHDSVVAALGPGCVRVDQDTTAGTQGSAFGSKLEGVEAETRSNHWGSTHG